MKSSIISDVHNKRSNVLYNVLFFILAKGTIGQKLCKVFYKSAIAEAPFDVVIIPGAPYLPEMNEMFRQRLNWSIHLYKTGIVKNIIYSGNAVHTPWIEGAVMASIAASAGIPKQNIYQETKAEHTVENLFYGIALARSKGFSKIAFASDPIQCKFIQKFLPHTGTEVTLIPILNEVYRNVPELKPVSDLMFPKQKDFEPLAKRKSLMQILRGTLGWKYLP